MQDWLTFVVVSVVALVGGSVVASRIADPRVGRLLVPAIVMRIVGSTARLAVIDLAYSGMGDAKMYFEFGKLGAGSIASLDFSFLTGAADGEGRFYGTQFIQSVTAFVVFLVGDSIRATFLVFSLFSFAGLWLCVSAFGVTFERSPSRYAAWLWFLPSLWFWPCSIGKEALMLLALGLVLSGYVGRGQSPRWLGVISGVLLAGAIRPHVGAVFSATLAVAELLRRGGGSRRGRWIALAGAALLLGATVSVGLEQMGLADADLEGLEEQFQFRAGQTEQGGSQIGRATGWAAVPMAFVNVLLRPFPWEAAGISLFSALEIWTFWVVAYRNRKAVVPLLSRFRENRFLVLAVPFAVSLTLLYGIAFANLGIIARQRAILLPLLLSLLGAAESAPAKEPAPVPRDRLQIGRRAA